MSTYLYDLYVAIVSDDVLYVVKYKRCFELLSPHNSLGSLGKLFGLYL
jgi:hypothetical protein